MKPRKAQLGALSLKERSLGHNIKPSFVHREEDPTGFYIGSYQEPG